MVIKIWLIDSMISKDKIFIEKDKITEFGKENHLLRHSISLIIVGHRRNFQKYKNGVAEYFGEKYDKGSLMQYGK